MAYISAQDELKAAVTNTGNGTINTYQSPEQQAKVAASEEKSYNDRLQLINQLLESQQKVNSKALQETMSAPTYQYNWDPFPARTQEASIPVALSPTATTAEPTELEQADAQPESVAQDIPASTSTSAPATTTVDASGNVLPIKSYEDATSSYSFLTKAWDYLAHTTPKDWLPLTNQVAQHISNRVNTAEANDVATINSHFANRYGITSDGLPYEKMNGEAVTYSPTSAKGKYILNGFQNLANTNNIATPTTPQQSELQKASKTVQTPQEYAKQQLGQTGATPNTAITQANAANQAANTATNQPETNLAKAGKSAAGAPLAKGTYFAGSQRQLDNMIKVDKEVSKLTVDNVDGMASSLDQWKDNFVQLQKNAINSLGSKASIFGSAKQVNWVMQNQDADENAVADWICEQKHIDPAAANGISSELSRFKSKYPELPFSVIGAMMSKLLTDQAGHDWTLRNDNEIANGVYLKGNLFVEDGALDDMLDKLAGKDENSEGSFMKVKEQYDTTMNLLSEAKKIDTAFQLASSAVAQCVADKSTYGAKARSPYMQGVMEQRQAKALQYMQALVGNSKDTIINLLNTQGTPAK